jgi:hypothetical protein
MLRNPGLRKSVEQPVLDLNFAASQIGSNGAPDGRMNDFNRGSNAWFVDTDGLVKKSPHNLLLQSEDLSTTWSKLRANVTTNATTSPIGTLTADKLYLDSTSSTSHFAIQNVSIGAGQKHTFSVYLKASELTFAYVTLLNNSSPYQGITIAVNLSDGSTNPLNVSPGATEGSFSVTEAGNGWYRVQVSGIIGSSASIASAVIYLAESTSTFIMDGDGSSGIFVWGAQFSQHTTLPVDNPYIKTEGSAVYAARLDHDPTWFMSAAQEQNLLQTSDLDDNTQYGLGRSTIAEQSSVENPFGGTDGVYLHLETAAGGSSYIYLFSGANWQQYVTEGKQYTLSIYAKQFNGQKLELRSPNNDFRNARFNVDTGVIEEQDSLLDDATIEDVGNGWFRCSITDTIATFSPTTWILAYLYNDLASPDYGLYYYGAQLEVGSTASTYHRTEGAPYYGEGATPKGLLIEEARTNLITDSEDFSAASWSLNPAANLQVNTNQVLAPDGTTTADELEVTGTPSAAVYKINDAVNLTSGQTYIGSVFGKKSEQRYLVLAWEGAALSGQVKGGVDLETGNIITGSDASTTVEDYGNGWYRVSLSATATSSGSAACSICINDADDVTVSHTPTAGDSIYIWGAQIEQGSFPTSYIQTTGTTLTRDADVAVMGPTTGGTELVTNGTFDTDVSNWVEHNANSSITYDSGAAIISSNQYNEIRQVLSLVEGRRYRASMDVITRTSGSWFFLLAHDATSSFAQGAFGDGTTQTFDFTAGAVNTLRIYPYTTGNPDTIKVDNISVRELYPFEQYNPSEGTVVCDFDCVSANTKGPFHFYEGTGFRGWGIRVINDSGTIIDGISRDASGFNNASVSGVNVSNLTRAVASVNSSGHMVAGGSGNSGSNTGNTVSLPVDRLDIGSSNIGGSNTGTMSGHIRRLKYSTRFVTELEAKNLTDD